MDIRMNAGYIITDSVHIENTEFVLGVSSTEQSMFVTWQCTGGNNYFWGHYHDDLLNAKKDLLARANEELEYQMDRRARAAERQPREQDKERER